MTQRAGKKGAWNPGEGGVHALARAAVLEIASESPNRPPADINETAEGLVIRIELPGVPAGDIRVLVQGSTIEVAGEKGRERLAQEASFLCLERAFGPFRRAFELSGCFNMSGVTAELSGGVLTVAIPKCGERRGRARRIPISTRREMDPNGGHRDGG